MKRHTEVPCLVRSESRSLHATTKCPRANTGRAGRDRVGPASIDKRERGLCKKTVPRNCTGTQKHDELLVLRPEEDSQHSLQVLPGSEPRSLPTCLPSLACRRNSVALHPRRHCRCGVVIQHGRAAAAHNPFARGRGLVVGVASATAELPRPVALCIKPLGRSAPHNHARTHTTKRRTSGQRRQASPQAPRVRDLFLSKIA